MSLDDRVSTAQVQKAIKSLMSYAAKKKQDTIDEGKTLFAENDEENVWLVVTTKVMHPQLTFKPQRIPLAYPLVDPRVSPVCLITKDPQRKYKDLLAEKGINFISKVVGIEKLKGKYGPYDARRQLAGDYGLFLADDSVIPLLPKLLGKAFFKSKKQPIPVDLKKKDLKGELEKAISATYLHQNAGTCTTIKIGNTGMDVTKLVKNAESAIPAVVRKLHMGTLKKNSSKSKDPHGVTVPLEVTDADKKELRETAWNNIQSLGIKTQSSVCLPIWSCQLSERWITAPSELPPKRKTKDASKRPLIGTSDTSDDAKKSKKSKRPASEEGDETMSEGESSGHGSSLPKEESDALSKKLAKSSLVDTPKATKRPNTTDAIEESKIVKKRRKDSTDEEVVGPKAKQVPSMVKVEEPKVTKKKRKDSGAESNGIESSESKEKKPKSKVDVEMAVEAPAPVGQQRKADRARAIDFMGDDASLKKVEKSRKESAPSTEAPSKESKNSSKSTPVIPSTSTSEAKETSPEDDNGSKKPKSILKKRDSEPSLTPAELAAKKARRATFSVVEKKKEKITKGAVGGHSGKSGKAGKSKASLVGRGPKM